MFNAERPCAAPAMRASPRLYDLDTDEGWERLIGDSRESRRVLGELRRRRESIERNERVTKRR